MDRIDTSYRNIGRIVAPVLVSTASYTAMGVIDTMMVGRLGVLELGAVGLGNLLTWWFLSFFFGLITVVNTFVAQAYGADDRRAVGAALWQGIYMAIGAGCLILLCWFAMPAVFALTRAEPELQQTALAYSRIRILGAFGLTFLAVADNFYRGLGRTDIPMWSAWIQLALNCGFNYLFIFGALGFPALGARGAALGTVIAQMIVGAGLMASIFVWKRWRSEFELIATRALDWKLLRSMIGVSLPIGVQFFMEMGGIALFSAVVARLGTAEMAASNAVIQAWSVAFMLGVALAVGATTLVGQCLGARQVPGARQAVGKLWNIGLVLTALCSIVYIGFPEALMRAFVKADEVQQLLPYASPLFVVVCVCLLLDLRFNLISGALRGAGDTTYSMVVNVGSAWLVFVPLTVWASSRWGLVGAWWCFVVHLTVMVFFLEIRYRGSRWIHDVWQQSKSELASADSAGVGDVTAAPEVEPSRSAVT